MIKTIKYVRNDEKSNVVFFMDGDKIGEIEHSGEIVKKHGVMINPDPSGLVDESGPVEFVRRE